MLIMENKRNNSKKWTIIAVACLIVFILAVIAVILMTVGKKEDLDKYKKPDTTIASSTELTTEEPVPETEPPLPDNPIDFEALKKENTEIYAWIKVPGTKVDYPIEQSMIDDSFYLRRDYLGRPSVSGCIFTQSMNKLDFSDPNTLVYGHYMYDGTFFGSLHNFRDPDFFSQNHEIFIYTEGHILTYEIFAAYEYDDRHILLSFDFSDREVFENYLKDCLNPQSMSRNVREGVTLNGDSKIITLSTCVQSGEDGKRYLVQGVLINDEKTK